MYLLMLGRGGGAVALEILNSKPGLILRAICIWRNTKQDTGLVS